MSRSKKRRRQTQQYRSPQRPVANHDREPQPSARGKAAAVLFLLALVATVTLPFFIMKRGNTVVRVSSGTENPAGRWTREAVPAASDFRLTIPSMHASPVIKLVFSPDGRYLASLGSQNDVKVWDIEKRTLVGDILYREKTRVNCMTFAPSRGADWALAAGLESGAVLFIDHRWNIESQIKMQVGAPIRDLFLSGDQRYLVSLGDYRWTAYPTGSGNQFESELVFDEDHICSGTPGEAEGDPITGSTFGYRTWAVAPDTHLVSLGCAALSLVPNRLSTVANEDRFFGRDRPAIMKPDEKPGVGGFRAYEACNTPFLLRFRRQETKDAVETLTDHKLTDYLSYPYRYDVPIMQDRDTQTGKEYAPTWSIKGEWPPFDKQRLRSVLGLAFRSDGRYLASSHDDRYVRIWSTAAKLPGFNHLVARERFEDPVSGVAYSSDGRRLAAVELGESQVVLNILDAGRMQEPTEVDWVNVKKEKVGEFTVDVAEGLAMDRPQGLPRRHSLTLQEAASQLLTNGQRTAVAWIGEDENILLWSERAGRLYLCGPASSIVRSFGRGGTERLSGNEAVTAVAVSPSSPYFAFGEESGEVVLRHQQDPYEPVDLIPPITEGSVLMPEACPFPPPWVYTPAGTLTLRSVFDDRELLGDRTANSWRTAIGLKKAFVVTGKGKVIVLDLFRREPPIVFDSPLGAFGPSLSPLGGNTLEYALARTYLPRIEPVQGSEYRAWKEQAALVVKFTGTGAIVNTLTCDRANKLIVAGGTTNSVFAMDMSSGMPTKLLDYTKGVNCRFALASEANILLAWWCEDMLPARTSRRLLNAEQPGGVVTRIVAIDLATLRPVNRWKLPGICSSLSIARNGSTVAGVWVSEARVFGLRDSAPTKTIQLAAQVKVPLLRDPWVPKQKWNEVEVQRWYFPDVAVSPDGNRLYFFDESDNFVHYTLKTDRWRGFPNVLDWQISVRPPWQSNRALFSPSGRWVVFTGLGRNLRLVDVERGTSTTLAGHLGLAYPSSFSADEKLLITSGGESSLRVWDVSTGKLTLEFRMFGVSDWVARTPDGRWDGTVRGMERSRLTSGSWQASLAGSTDYWTPGLVKRVLEGTDTPIGTEESFGIEASRTPIVRIVGHTRTSTDTAALQVEVSGRGEAPTGLFVFVNGKLTERQDVSMKPQETRTFAVSGVPLGASENHIRVIVGTAARARSASAELRLTRPNAPKPILYALCIGVNGKDLTYARSDAEAMSRVLRSQPTSLYKEVRLVELYDEDATKSRIQEGVSNVARQAQPHDLFIFYFAGHGEVFQPTSSPAEACLMPIDALGQAPTSQNAISLGDVQRWMITCKAQKQLWVFDACYSGMLSSGLGKVAFSESVQRLAFNVGYNIIAATQPLEKAVESERLRGGVLTGVLLERLRSRSGNPVRLSELTSGLKEQIDSLTNGLQRPTIHLASQESPLFLQASGDSR